MMTPERGSSRYPKGYRVLSPAHVGTAHTMEGGKRHTESQRHEGRHRNEAKAPIVFSDMNNYVRDPAFLMTVSPDSPANYLSEG
jgi:hypothetical protein